MSKEQEDVREPEGLSRRQILTGAAVAALGGALLGGFGPTAKVEAARRTEEAACLENPITTPSGAKYPWPYVKLDPELTAEIAYQNWYKGFCSYAVASAILGQLQQEVGEPYTMLPIVAFSYGHGGTLGWGTICGTLFAAGICASFTAGQTGDKITNDLLAWYSDTELPIFKPKNPKATFKNVNTSGSPLCHISVGKWMKKENVGFFSPQRKDRCARLAGDVAAQTVRYLNAVADGTYKATHGNQAAMFQITAQSNCTDCHGSDIPAVPGI